MQSFNPTPTSGHDTVVNLPAFTQLCKSVLMYFHVNSARPSLSTPYTGPLPVLFRKDKQFIIKVKNKKMTVFNDRLKPAYVLSEFTDSLVTPSNLQPSKILNSEPVKKDELNVLKP